MYVCVCVHVCVCACVRAYVHVYTNVVHVCIQSPDGLSVDAWGEWRGMLAVNTLPFQALPSGCSRQEYVLSYLIAHVNTHLRSNV